MSPFRQATPTPRLGWACTGLDASVPRCPLSFDRSAWLKTGAQRILGAEGQHLPDLLCSTALASCANLGSSPPSLGSSPPSLGSSLPSPSVGLLWPAGQCQDKGEGRAGRIAGEPVLASLIFPVAPSLGPDPCSFPHPYPEFFVHQGSFWGNIGMGRSRSVRFSRLLVAAAAHIWLFSQ